MQQKANTEAEARPALPPAPFIPHTPSRPCLCMRVLPLPKHLYTAYPTMTSPMEGGSGPGGSVKVTCVRKMAGAAALYCVFYLY